MVKLSKKIILLLLVVAVAMSSVVMFAGCDKEDREVLIEFHYTLTTQYTTFDSYIIGSIIYKPENPIMCGNVFSKGYDKNANSKVDPFELPIINPRLEEGYSRDVDYYFVGWYTEPEFVTKWDFSEDRIYRDMTLYAKWIVKTW